MSASAGLMDKYTSPHYGLNPNEDKIKAQLQSGIETLSADPDVQGFLQTPKRPRRWQPGSRPPN